MGALATIGVEAGELEQFFYAPLDGGTVAELTAAPEFPEQPFVVTPVNWFNTGLEGLTNASFHYGSWLRGYLEAPVTGDYVFYLSADDSAEFHLSTDHTPANQRLVARVASPVPHAAYDWQYDQRSVVIALERGRQYYFEVLHKQSAGTDHVQVGWLRPDDVLERPIPLRYVQRFVPASYQGPAVREPAVIAPWIELPPPMAGTLHARENQYVVLAPHVSARPPVEYQWWEDGVPLPGENLSSLDLGAVSLADDGRVFQLQVTTAAGSTLSEDWRLRVAADVTPPALVSATVVGMIDGFVLRFSEPVDPATATNAANYTLNLGITVNGVSLLHGTNQTAVVVRTSPFPLTGRPEVTVHGVRDLAQPPNEIAPGSTLLISQAEGRITLRYTGAIHGRPPVDGTAVEDVVVAGHFQYDPALTTVRTELGIPPNFADDYAAQLIGYLIPPVTGDYRFWIASDDQGILYLSPDADPMNKRAIALDPQWNGWRSYTTADRRTLANTGNSAFIYHHFPDIGPNVPVNDSLNTVGWIHLEAGRRYYLEALMKEGGGGDNLDVTWQLPGGPAVVDGQAPIPGEFLAQWAGGITGEVVITNRPAFAAGLEGRR
ncbi:MAG TPA: PA14 domain-containing protein, partial [Verrucomicrobiae bacterium]|nr:PA14 domain-containing protein [Verrucomicrobiae bacterium]